MNFLAVDTSSDYLTVLAVKNGEVFSTFLPDCAMKHSVTLMSAVDETLTRANLAVADCDFFACAVGAGSFTGIRIGISAMKGFALATGKPTIGITSFETLAYTDTKGEKRLCLVNALHDCYYACGYVGEECILPPAYLTEAEVLALVDEGYALYAGAEIPLAQKCDVRIVSPEQGLLLATQAKARAGAFGELEALYVRKSSAELNVCK